jgi:BirA family biotin operon repressor/biotin-[acetyl-CoA-carboxylase] ligase
MPGFISRQEQFDVVGSTNDVVRGWLGEGTPEVCIAVAAEQTAGRGREGRTWTAPYGHALLASLGFRPTWLPPDRVWRLAAIVSLAMAEAGDFLAGLAPGSIRLKWPNDLVVEAADGSVRKLAGVLGETDGLGTNDPRAVVGIGINADWPADEFPADLVGTMTSLAAEGGRHIDEHELLEAFLVSLEPRLAALRSGRFDADEWSSRQVTNDRDVDLIAPDGASTMVRAHGVDTDSGALLVDGRRVLVGEIAHVRFAEPARARSAV